MRSAADYQRVVLAYRNGAAIHLTDVGQIIDGAENSRLAAWAAVNGHTVPAVIINVQRQPGSNVIATVDRIRKLLPQLRATLPGALQVTLLADRTDTIRASVRDVQFELTLSIALVVLVIFLFLRSLPTTIIPSVVVPVSIIGTFGVMYLAGFSLNNLTIMALTIATGFVVDDAIVMIENISRYVEQGVPPIEAALRGSRQIGFTIISLTVSLIAVLIPLLFMREVVGRLFREFAITLAIAIVISAIVSLTLTPMMCARLLKPRSRRPPHAQAARRRLVRASHRRLRSPPAPRPGASHRHAGRGRGDAGADHRPVYRDPQGLLSAAGHGRAAGHYRGFAVDLIRCHGRAAAGPGRRACSRTRRSPASPPSLAWMA